MKTIIKAIICIALLFQTQITLASPPSKDTTVSFTVFGECELCQKRIEDAAVGRGVSSAKWDVETKIFTVKFNPEKTSREKIEERIVAAGHDTKMKKAADNVYSKLPDCCLYRIQQTETNRKSSISTLDLHEASAENKANNNEVTGTVGYEANGQLRPLQGASIMWLGANAGTVTDTSGSFKADRISGTNTVVVSYAGYHTDTILLADNGTVHIVLQPANQLRSVMVKTFKSSFSVNTASAIRSYDITPKELLKAACCNLSESFETNPSVDVSYNDAVTGSKQIQMLGLAGNYSQLTVENLPGPRGLATPLGLNSISGTWVDGIQLIKGTGSVVNGFESIAGQINVELKKPDNSDRLYANVYTNDFGKTDFNLNLSRKINKKWSTALLLHDAFGYNKQDVNNDGFRDNPTGNLFSGASKWSYADGNGFFTQFGFKYMKDNKVGGEVAFNPSVDKLSNNIYGLQINIDREEAYAKVGYVYPGQPYKSIGLQLAAFDHTQNSYFGFTTYNGNQKSFYSNLIYQSIIGHTGHKFKTGLSFSSDKYDEQFNKDQYSRNEIVPGAFFEYVFKPGEKFELIAGLRGDYNNLYGFFATPRLNVKYEPVKGTTIRVSAGRGQRTANIFAENNSVFVSSRKVNIITSLSGKAYGLDPESAWNKGISVDQKFRLFERSSTLSFDFFRNDFTNQVVVDLENAREVNIYNLNGKSYSNSCQTELSVEPVKNLQVRLAYRYFDVKTTYNNQLLQRPLTAKHRAFANFGYETGTWKFDYTVSYNGSKRLPATSANPDMYKLSDYSSPYVVMNAMISKTISRKTPVDIYIGSENITDYYQANPIVAADKPFSPYFDASMIWGPVTGRMFYGGLRFKIK